MEIKVNVSLSLSPDLEALINRAFAALVNTSAEVEEIISKPVTTGYAQETGTETTAGVLTVSAAAEPKTKHPGGRPRKEKAKAEPAPAPVAAQPELFHTNGTIEVPEELEELPTPAQPAAPEPAPAPVRTIPAPAPAPAPATAQPGTLQQIISTASIKATAGKRPQIKALLDDFMCPSLSAIPAEEQGRFLTALNAI